MDVPPVEIRTHSEDKEEEKPHGDVEFAQVLAEAGEFGSFQKWLLVGLFFPSIFSAFNVIGQVFTGLSFPHHCNTDWILERGPNMTRERQRNLTLPVDKYGQFESCAMFTPVDWDLETIEAQGMKSTVKCVHGWDYDTSIQFSSIVTEMDLVCENNGLIEMSQSMFMAGCLIGSILIGVISDRFGRRFSTLTSLLGLFLFGLGTAFSPNIYVYIALKFFCGVTGVIVIQATVIGREWTGKSKSSFSAMVILLSYPLGLMLLPAMAYFISNWRILQLVFFGPLILLVGIYYWLLPESPRWLMSQGKKEEVEKELLRAARVNRRTIPQNMLDELKMEKKERENMCDIFRSSIYRKYTFIMGFIWFSTSVFYYGLSLNVGSFGLDVFLTQFIFGTVEIPAVLSCFFFTHHLGRKPSQAGFLFFGGAACLLILVIPKDFPVVITVIAVIGKYSASASFSTAYIYTLELYPTSVRQNGAGLTSVCGRVAGAITPLIRLLDVYHHMVPMLIYGSIPLIAGFLCLLLPETRHEELKDHIERKGKNAEPEQDESTMVKLMKV